MANIALPSRPYGDEYLKIGQFAKEYDGISYLQLDSYTVERVNLFAVPDHERFLKMEARLDRIIAALPSLKRIFSNPITRLKDVKAVLPVDSVRVIDHSTMRHASVHTEFWGNITEDSLVPRKLLTVVNEEEYKIYENVAFAQLVSAILGYAKANIRLCKNVIYSSRPMNFDLLERRNHLMYFLALGKLHVGYANTQDGYHYIHSRCLEKLLYIDRVLHSKLNSPVYRICKKDKTKLILKRTNIFRSQKDYKQVYSLLKLFGEDEERTDIEVGERGELGAYADYCTLLSLFSARHFNFGFDEKEGLHFCSLDTTCRFKDWSLRIERFSESELEGLRFTVTKNTSYSVCLLFSESGEVNAKALEAFSKKYSADEFLTVRNDVRGIKGSIYLNIFDIDSFRRIQQLLLRCMIYSDSEHVICPFCGSPITESANGHECERCKTVIHRDICPEHEKAYFTVSLKDYRPNLSREKLAKAAEDAFLSERAEEAMLFYRNITALTKAGEPICPHCGKVH